MERSGTELYVAGMFHKRTFEGWMELSETIDRGSRIDFHVKHSRLD